MEGCKVLSKNEVKEVLKVAETSREKLFALCGLYFGTRISETVKFTFSDFEGKEIRINRGKGSKATTLEIPQQVKKELECLRKEYSRKGISVTSNTPVFLSQKGNNKPLTPTSGCRIVQGLFDRAGIKGKVGAHSFRKCFVTKIYEMCNYDLIATARFTGHKSINTLIYYIETTKPTNLNCQLSW